MPGQLIEYFSTDASAPVLTGEDASLTNLLTTILTGGGVAYGSKNAQNWAVDYTSTGIKTFRPPSGVRPYILVNDHGPGAGTFKEARVRGYLTKSNALDVPDVNNADPYPTVAQKTNGVFVRKSATADATARAWRIFANELVCYGFIYSGDTAGNASAFGFGDYNPLNPSDIYNTFVGARTTENVATMNSIDAMSALNNNQVGYSARKYTGAAGAIALYGGTPFGAQTAYVGAVSFPNPVDGSSRMARVEVWDEAAPWGGATSVHRGYFYGLWSHPHPYASSYIDGQLVPGLGDQVGKAFRVIATQGASALMLVEVSDTL